MAISTFEVIAALKDLRTLLKEQRRQLKALSELPQYIEPEVVAVAGPIITQARAQLAARVQDVTAAIQAIVPSNAEKLAYAEAKLAAAVSGTE